MTKHLLAPLLCALLGSLLPACDRGPSEAAHARALELESSPGLRVTISASDLDDATVHAIAKHLEGSAHDHGAATVKLKHENDNLPVLEIELWGGTLPTGDIAADLKQQFPALAAANINTRALAPGEHDASLPVIAVDENLSPEEVEQQIRDQLAAEGIDGEVNVTVKDGPDGRRVEVGVEKQEHK